MKKFLVWWGCILIALAMLWIVYRVAVAVTEEVDQAAARGRTAEARRRTSAIRYFTSDVENGYRRKYSMDIPHLVTLNTGFIPSRENNEKTGAFFYVKLEYQIVMQRVGNDFPGGPDIAKWELDSVNVFLIQGNGDG